MVKIIEIIKENFDLRDAFVFGGICLVAIGVGMVFLPAAFIVAGTALFWLGVK